MDLWINDGLYKQFCVFVVACHWMFVVLTVEEEMQYTRTKHRFILQTNPTTYFVLLQMINNHLK